MSLLDIHPGNLTIDTKKDGLERMTPLKYGNLSVSMLKFRGVQQINHMKCVTWISMRYLLAF